MIPDPLIMLRQWPPASRYRVAYSGGVDSHVLLALLCGRRGELEAPLAAVHVDHAIHPESASWVEHCRRTCAGLGVDLDVLHIDAGPAPGESPEARARELRYRALRGSMQEGEMLLTAHHRDDQAETLLLQLCRGAGPAGLAAMPALAPCGRGWHGRPLLEASRAELEALARERGLQWVDDDSNRDPRFDRNFMRGEIIPRLRSRWSGVSGALSRAATLQARAAELLDDLARSDAAVCGGGLPGSLSITGIAGLSEARQANLVRYWLRERNLPLPDSRRLRQILLEVVPARADAEPLVAWPGAEVRRYRDELFAFPPPVPHDPAFTLRWRPDSPCDLGHGTLQARAGAGDGIRMSACEQRGVEVRYRQGGERLQPAGAAGRRELKTLFQERGVPPWLRDRIPLLYIDDRLAAVAGLWVDAEFAAAPGEASWQVTWTPA